MSKKFYGGISVQNAQEIGFFDSDSSNSMALKAPAALSGNTTLTLPDGDSSGTQALVSNGAGALSWSNYLDDSLNDGLVYIGNGSNVATAVDTASVGDIDADATAGLTIKAGVIVDADINASAAITLSKLAATTASRALVSDASGFITASAVTDTEIGYLDGVTSAIQTQIDGKAATALSNLASVAINTSLVSDTNNTDDLGSAAIGWANGYINNLHLDGSTSGTTTISAAAAGPTITYTLPDSAPASNGYVLSATTGGVLSWVSNSAVNSFTDTWLNADGTSLIVSHNLGTTDVIVQLYDIDNADTIEVDSVVRTDSNTVTLTASQAPDNLGSGWKVLILAV